MFESKYFLFLHVLHPLCRENVTDLPLIIETVFSSCLSLVFFLGDDGAAQIDSLLTCFFHLLSANSDSPYSTSKLRSTFYVTSYCTFMVYDCLIRNIVLSSAELVGPSYADNTVVK